MCLREERQDPEERWLAAWQQAAAKMQHVWKNFHLFWTISGGGTIKIYSEKDDHGNSSKTPHLRRTNSFWIYSLHWFGLASKGPPADSCSRPECCTLLRRSPCVNFLAVYFMVVNQAKAMDKYDNAMFCQRWILDVSLSQINLFLPTSSGKI